MRRLGWWVAPILVLLLAVGPSAVAQGDLAEEWPPGVWIADFIVEGGIGESGQTTYLGGFMRMELTVDEAGDVVGGSLVTVAREGFEGLSLQADATDPQPATLDVIVTINMGLSGSSQYVEASGSWIFDGFFSSQGVTVPQKWEWAPTFRIVPEEASCASVWGNLFDPTLLVESGSIVTLTAKYLALPTGVGTDEIDVGDIVEEVENTSESLLEGGSPAAADILYLVRLVQAATGEIVREHLCDEIGPQGATAAHTWFEALLQDLLFAVFQTLDSQGNAYTTSELIELLDAGVSVGAVGASTVNPDAAQGLMGRFEFWLDVRADEAFGAGNPNELISIAVTAEQYGWPALANKAYGYATDLGDS